MRGDFTERMARARESHDPGLQAWASILVLAKVVLAGNPPHTNLEANEHCCWKVRLSVAVETSASGQVETFAGDACHVRILKHSTVFNADQVDGFEAAPTVERPTEVELIATADAFVANTGAAIRDGGTRAYYQPAGDFIGMPPRDLFQATKTSGATEGYYGTLLHELTHYAGFRVMPRWWLMAR